MNAEESKANYEYTVVNTRINGKYSSQSHQNKMNGSLKALFANKNWNPLIDGFKKCKKGIFTRFIFVANSCGFYDTPNKDILRQIFIKYGELYNVFIIDNKPFANIAFVNVNDAINAYFDLNGKENDLLQRKLYLDFSEPRYPKVLCFGLFCSFC